jgi:hypothetical protein
MTQAVVTASIALLVILLFVAPTWIVMKDLRSGRRDPEVE